MCKSPGPETGARHSMARSEAKARSCLPWPFEEAVFANPIPPIGIIESLTSGAARWLIILGDPPTKAGRGRETGGPGNL